jgi:hypothetical protein
MLIVTRSERASRAVPLPAVLVVALEASVVLVPTGQPVPMPVALLLSLQL